MGTKSLPLSRRQFLLGSAAAVSAVTLGAMTGCATNQNTSIEGVDPSEVLVVYYSKTGETQSIEGLETISKGHTEVMAEYIADAVGCDIFKIKPTVEYPESFQETQDIALNEFARTIYHEISNFDQLPKPMDEYKYLFVGGPNWYDVPPMVIYTFMRNYNMAGKTIIPFTTSAGGGLGNYYNVLVYLAPRATVSGDGLSVIGQFIGDSRDYVQSWARNLLNL